MIFFLIVNYAKLIPYAQLGQFDTANLATALVLSPLAPVGIWLGLWLHGRVPERTILCRLLPPSSPPPGLNCCGTAPPGWSADPLRIDSNSKEIGWAN